MRKLFLPLFSLAALVLTGCGTGMSPEDVAKYPYAMELSGTVEKVASWSPSAPYTHELMGEDGEVLIALKSKSVNLNKYLEKEVVVSGEVSLAKDNETEVMLVKEISAKDGGAGGEDTVFQDPRLNIKFTYPGDLTLENNGDSVDFMTESKKVVIRITHETSSESLEEFAGTHSGDKSATVAGVEAVRRTDSKTEQVSVFLKNGEDAYLIKLIDPEYKSAFEQSITSLTFLSAEGGEGMCGGSQGTKCETGSSCLLDADYDGATGKCVSTTTLLQDIAQAKKACDASQGYIKASTHTCTAESCAFASMPTCDCGGGRTWDEIEGCVGSDSVSSADEEGGEETSPEESVSEPTANVAPASGMARMSSGTYQYSVDYPKNWYYAGIGGGSYAFGSAEEPTAENAGIVVWKVSDCSAKSGTCVTVDGKKYVVEAIDSQYSSVAQSMASSIATAVAE